MKTLKKFTALVACIFLLQVITNSQSVFNSIPFDETIAINTNALPPGTQFVDMWGYPWMNASNCPGCFIVPITLGNGLYQCNRFKLAFADEASHSGVGFDDQTSVSLTAGHPLGVTSTTLGVLRRWTACQVFDYISQTIAIPSGQSPDVYFAVSETDGTGALAFATPFFTTSNTPAFTGGLLNQHIVTGVDPTPNATDYDSKITCDFAPNGAWPVNGNNIPINSDGFVTLSSSLDLYSILLHEATHALGFFSLAQANGLSAKTNSSPGIYSLFDRYILNSSSANLFNNSTYAFQGGTAQLTSNALQYFKSTNSKSYSVYSPLAWFYGSSLCHFDESRDNETYLMGPDYNGVRRTYSKAELETLCNMGYTLTASNFSCADRYAIGVNDNATSNSLTAPVTVNVIANDYDLDAGQTVALDAASVTLLTNAGAVTINGNSITLTPNGTFCGNAIIRYRPYTVQNNYSGSYATLTITITCPSYCPLDPCNLICNGSFEDNINLAQFNAIANAHPNGQQNVYYGGAPGWSVPYEENSYTFMRGATDFWGNLPQSGIPMNILTIYTLQGVETRITSQNRYSAVFTNTVDANGNVNFYPASLYTHLVQPLIPGQAYQLTFYMYGICTNSQNNTGCITPKIRTSFTTAAPVWPPASAFPVFPLINGDNLTTTTGIINSGTWTPVTINFTATNASNYFIVEGDNVYSTNTTNYIIPFTFLDDIRLVKAGNNISTNVTASLTNPKVGQNEVFTVTVLNTGSTTANNVQIQNTLPPGFSYVSSNFSAYPNHTISSLAPNSSVILTVTAQANPSVVFNTDIQDCASVTSSNACLQNGGCATVRVLATDLSISASVQPCSKFRATISNIGAVDAHNVTVDYVPPTCFGYQNYSVITGSATYASNHITIPLISAGSSVVVEFTGSSAASCTNTVTLSGAYDEWDLNSQNNSASATITIPALLANAGSDITTCGNGVSLVNPPLLIGAVSGGTSPYSYEWRNPNNSVVSTGIGYTVNGLSSTSTYTFSVTDANGCKNSDQVIVTADASCCSFSILISPNPVPVPSLNYYNVASSGLPTATLNSTSAILTQPYCFNGTTTITSGTNVTWANCKNLGFGENAKIVISPNAIFTLSGCSLQVMQGACSKMWQGIELTDQSSTLNIQKTTLANPYIKDAKNAVLSHKGGKYIISDCQFDRNWIDINLDGQYNSINGWGNYNLSSVKKCRFYSNGTLLASTPTPSYAGQRTSSAIYITDAINVKIGSTLLADSNMFGNYQFCTTCGINNAIYMLRSAVDIYYNKFENITNSQTGVFNATLTNGTGIYTEAPCLSPPSCIVGPGQSHSIYTNWTAFTNNTSSSSPNVKNVTRAMYDSQVQLTATDQCMVATDKGIEVANCKNKVMNVSRNYMYQSKYGISFALPQATSIDANDNYVELLTPPNNTSMYYGINLNEDINLNTATINVLRNNINNGMIGLQVSNAKLSSCSLSNNTIKVWHPNTAGVNYPVNGISLISCQNILVNNNKVYDLVNNWINQYNVYNSLTWAANVKGIALYNSGQGVRLLCNHTLAINYGIAFSSTNGTNAVPVNIYHNLFEYHKYALVLSNANGTSGEVGNQGIAGVLSNGNEFGFASGNITHTLSVSSNSINNAQIFYRTGTTEGPLTTTTSGIPVVALSGSAIPNGSAVVVCSVAIPLMAQGGSSSSNATTMKFEQVAEQLTTEEAVVENTQNFEEVKNWMNQRDLYNKLDDSTAIVEQSQQLQSYVEEKQTESIGQSEDFSKMITALNDNAVLSDSVLYTAKIAEAGQKNEEIGDTKQYEAAQKTINSIYLNKVNKDGISEFSASEKAQISNIAHQCVFVYGNAVYLARALYALEHPEEILMDYLLCANSYKKEEESPVGEKILDLKIIPNPANEKVLMVCDLRGYLDATLQITDITGQVVLTQKLDINTPLTEINTSYLSSGVYYPKIVADHQLIGGKKIVIAH